VYQDHRRRGLKSEGCQYKIADQIVEAGADYLFSLKGNQPTLYDEVTWYFEPIDTTHPDPTVGTHTTFDVDHGRLERRFHGIIEEVAWLRGLHPSGKSIKSIGIIDSTREKGDAIFFEWR
jgi:hypothetical protein